MRLVNTKQDRLIILTQLAWTALIQASPDANPAMLATRAKKLAECFLAQEENDASQED